MQYKRDVINKGRLLLRDVIKYDGLLATQTMMTSLAVMSFYFRRIQ